MVSGRAAARVSAGRGTLRGAAKQAAGDERREAGDERREARGLARRLPQLEVDQTALLVPVGAIVLGDNARRQWDVMDERLERLAVSIQEQGLLEPLIVRELSERSVAGGRTFELVAGFRRFAAAQRLKLARVPVRVVALSDDEALAANLAENLARQDLPEEEAMRAVERLQETYQWGVRRIARATGRSVGWISELLAVSRSRPEREAVERGRIALSTAFRLARLRRAFPELRAQLLERIQAGETLQLDDVPRVRQLQPAVPVAPVPVPGDGPDGDALAPPPDPVRGGDVAPPPAGPVPAGGAAGRGAAGRGTAGGSVLRLGQPELALARNMRLVVRQVLSTIHRSWAEQGLHLRLPAELREDVRSAAEEIARFLGQESGPPLGGSMQQGD